MSFWLSLGNQPTKKGYQHKQARPSEAPSHWYEACPKNRNPLVTPFKREQSGLSVRNWSRPFLLSPRQPQAHKDRFLRNCHSLFGCVGVVKKAKRTQQKGHPFEALPSDRIQSCIWDPCLPWLWVFLDDGGLDQLLRQTARCLPCFSELAATFCGTISNSGRVFTELGSPQGPFNGDPEML